MSKVTHWSRAASLIALLVACSGGSSGPATPSGASLRIISGASITDTVDSPLSVPLVVEVHDANGLAVGAAVQFTGVPTATPLAPYMRVGVYQAVAIVNTDARGRASINTITGSTAGPAEIRVSVDYLGLVDTAHYTILPGAVARIVATPADTAAYAGKSYTLRAWAGDRHGNRRTDPLSFTSRSARCTVDPSGTVHAALTGRCTIVMGLNALVDSVAASVVPVGKILFAQTSLTGLDVISTSELDGSNLQQVAGIARNPASYGMGSMLAWGNYDGLFVKSTAGTTKILDNASVGLEWVNWLRFAPNAEWIYFSGLPLGTRDGPRLYRIHVDGSGFQPVVVPGQSQVAFQADPSPDGLQLVYKCDSGLCIFTMATGARRVITDIAGEGPRWSPTGDRISYSAGGRMRLVNPDGTGDHPISPDIITSAEYGWSQDGAWMVCRGYNNLLLLNVATEEVLPLPYSFWYSTPSFLR